MAREADINAFQGERLVIAPGATLALLVQPYPGEVASIIKYFSGGSLEIVSAPPGISISQNQANALGLTTWAGASLVNLIGTGYLVGTSEIVNITGPGKFYLIATGATVTCMHLVGRSQGF